MQLAWLKQSEISVIKMEFAIDLNTIINGCILGSLMWHMKKIREIDVKTQIHEVKIDRLETTMAEV